MYRHLPIGLNLKLINQIKLQMTMKIQLSQQTSPNSPTRPFPHQSLSKHFIINPPTNYTTPRVSQTQSEIYSHRLIREVMEASRARSIHHDINKVDNQSTLYSVPLRQEAQEYYIDSIPPKNQLFLSLCSKTINNINESFIMDSRNNSKFVTQRNKNRRPQSATSKINTYNKKVSVSGLVTYKFDSLLAKKSLGFNLINHEQKMIHEMGIANKKLHCARERVSRIIGRSSQKRQNKRQKDQRAIMGQFQSDTNSYLQNIIAEKEQNAIIYGQRTKKINCIKQYMQNENVDYAMAIHAVTTIEGLQKKQKRPEPKIEKKIQNDQAKLNKRREPMQRKPVLVRNFYFIE